MRLIAAGVQVIMATYRSGAENYRNNAGSAPPAISHPRCDNVQSMDERGRPADKAPNPAFMQIEGRLVRPLPPEATTVTVRNFWLVQPWVIVTIVIAIMVALVIPGLLMDLNRGF